MLQFRVRQRYPGPGRRYPEASSWGTGCCVPGELQLHRSWRPAHPDVLCQWRERFPAGGKRHPYPTPNPRSHPEGAGVQRGSPRGGQPTIRRTSNRIQVLPGLSDWAALADDQLTAPPPPNHHQTARRPRLKTLWYIFIRGSHSKYHIFVLFNKIVSFVIFVFFNLDILFNYGLLFILTNV